MRKIPDSLRDLQQSQREQTVSAVKDAIQELCAERCTITIKRLCERTGLSRSVFSKPHVKSVVDKAKISNSPAKAMAEESLQIKYDKLLLQLENSRQRESYLKASNVKLRETVLELRSECELLRGELHVFMRQCRIQQPKGGESD
jgi:hypothetical protein